MNEVERICVVCKKEDRGSGVWAYQDSPSATEQEDGLCPTCCQELFPDFYAGCKRAPRRRFRVGRFLRSVLHPFRSEAGSVQ